MAQSNHSILDIVAFTTGAAVMIFELVGSRILAPYFGNSLYVWTNLIGTILASLSAGYYWGGKLADKGANQSTIASLLTYAGLLMVVVAFFKEPVLRTIATLLPDNLALSSLCALIILCAPVSFVLGAISPYIAKLRIESLRSVGRDVGRLSAISTWGSIVGTFATGFLLIPNLGHTIILYALASTLMILGLIVNPLMWKVAGLSSIGVIVVFALNQGGDLFRLNTLADHDSPYNRIVITAGQVGDRQVISLQTDSHGSQSAVYQDAPDELVFSYTRAYELAEHLIPNLERTLMMGGAGYTYPRHFVAHNPSATMDVIEIDPDMVTLAREYMFFRDDPRLKLITAEARSYLLNNASRYDTIFLDAYLAVTPPYHLTTVEFMSELSSHLVPGGLLLINLISAVTSEESALLTYQLATMQKVFAHVQAFQVDQKTFDESQNILLVASDSPLITDQISTTLGLNNITREVNTKNSAILTDDYAPVEYLTLPLYND